MPATFLLVIGALTLGADTVPTPEKHEWTINKVKRTGLIYAPATAHEKATPVVFAFHGHGGNMNSAARSFPMHKLWPEAICVYLEGLPTPGQLTDPEGKKNGWQKTKGDQDDRDLNFFDTVLEDLKKKYKVDPKRIYAMGHSNGGAFTYLLWAQRGDTFAALAPSAAGARTVKDSKPIPLMHIAGEQDPLVKFEYQKQIVESVKKVNGSDKEGKPWNEKGTKYESKTGTPVVAVFHQGTHTYPSWAPALIVKFFQEQTKP